MSESDAIVRGRRESGPAAHLLLYIPSFPRPGGAFPRTTPVLEGAGAMNKKTILITVVFGVVAGVGGRMALRGQAGSTEAEANAPRPAAVELVAANGTVEGRHPEVG